MSNPNIALFRSTPMIQRDEEHHWSIQQVGIEVLLGISLAGALENDYKIINLGPFLFSIPSSQQELPPANLNQSHWGSSQNCWEDWEPGQEQRGLLGTKRQRVKIGLIATHAFKVRTLSHITCDGSFSPYGSHSRANVLGKSFWWLTFRIYAESLEQEEEEPDRKSA